MQFVSQLSTDLTEDCKKLVMWDTPRLIEIFVVYNIDVSQRMVESLGKLADTIVWLLPYFLSTVLAEIAARKQ